MTPRCHGSMLLMEHDTAYGQYRYRCPSCDREVCTGPSDTDIYRREHRVVVPNRVRPVAAQLEGEWL